MSSTLAERLGLSHRLIRPSHLLAFILASSSIASLLAYFSGVLSMPVSVKVLLVPSVVLLVLLAVGSLVRGHEELARRLLAGLWAGAFATLAYDVVRVPLAHAGLPVFKAISYFGTIILSTPRPTAGSEVVGWSYHLSNGIGFAMMYTLLVRRPRLLSAVLWGVTLESVMLVTPYAEVFGYRISPAFLAVTLGSHVVYGIVLWLTAGRAFDRLGLDSAGYFLPPTGRALALWLGALVGIGMIAGDFHRLHAETIPASPPDYIGEHLYVTWNVPEPDRIGAIWLMLRHVEPRARFYFIEPMSKARFGKPFDMPEAEIRRYHNRSAFQFVLDESGLRTDPGMEQLAQLCYLSEIRPWALHSDARISRLENDLTERITGCRDLSDCIDEGLRWFDETYSGLRASEGPRRGPDSGR